MERTTKHLSAFDTALYAFEPPLARLLGGLPEAAKASIQEIRLRAELPVCLTGKRTLYLSDDGRLYPALPSRPLTVSRQQLYDVLVRLTGKSVYTRTHELQNGYLSMKRGHRAGICGKFSGGYFLEVSSINIRIARSVVGCAASLYDAVEGGLLIAGSPGSGKTTLLRDVVRHISDAGQRVCVVDTRGEIAACEEGIPCLDVGVNTDVLTGTSKAQGTEIALRTMFPQIIAFDEIGTAGELQGVRESFFAGVSILTTAHASSVLEIRNRPVVRGLIESGAVARIALLSGGPGEGVRLFSRDEVFGRVGV